MSTVPDLALALLHSIFFLFIPFCSSQYDGYPDECIVEGVCKYVDIGQGPVSYEPTTGGKGKSEWAAHVDAGPIHGT